MPERLFSNGVPPYIQYQAIRYYVNRIGKERIDGLLWYNLGMKEIVLPRDGDAYSHVLIKRGGSNPKYFLRYGAINQLHADIAERVAKVELGLDDETIEKSDYLKREVNGFSVCGAGEFRVSGRVFIHRPVSASYNGLCLTELSRVLKRHGYSVRQTTEDFAVK